MGICGACEGGVESLGAKCFKRTMLTYVHMMMKTVVMTLDDEA